MTDADSYAFLRSERVALQRLIDGCSPDDVSRLGFEGRLAAVENELAQLDGPRERQAEATIYFKGAPVIGSRGIEAAFAAEAIESFQKLVSKMSAFKSGRRIGERGPIPGASDSRLYVTATAPGSFGFVLREVAAPSQVSFEPTALAAAVDATATLLARAASTDDEFADAVVETDGAVLDQLDDFLGVVGEHGATLRVVTEGIVASLDDGETLAAARERARSRRTEVREQPEHGVLVGLMTDARRFELRTGDGTVIAGRLGDAVDADAAAQLMFRAVAGHLRVVVIARRGRETKRYVLEDVAGEPS